MKLNNISSRVCRPKAYIGILIALCLCFSLLLFAPAFLSLDHDSIEYSAPSKFENMISSPFESGSSSGIDQVLLALYLQLQNDFKVGEDLIYDGEGSSKEILIFSLNTKPLDVLTTETDLSKISYQTIQAYYTLAYCIHHGYSYRFFLKEPLSSRCSSWHKPIIAQEMVLQYSFVIVLDNDAYFTTFDLRLEELMRSYGFTNETVVAAAVDPKNDPGNYIDDVEGNRRIWLNTGFMFFRGSQRAHQILKLLNECELDICKHYYQGFPCDQGSFSAYIMPKLSSHEVLQLPCSDFNGYSGTDDERFSECRGTFVTHPWAWKHLVGKEVLNIFRRVLMVLLHKNNE